MNQETDKTTIKLTVQFPDKLNGKQSGFIDFYVAEENFVIENNNVVGFKLASKKERKKI